MNVPIAGQTVPGPGTGPCVDLHMHSTASDGTVAPADVARAVADAGLDGFSLTDHDTTQGLAEAETAARKLGLRFLPGAELSANEPGRSVHLLAYGFDVADPDLQGFLSRYREDRLRRAREIVARLQAAGAPVTWEDVELQTGAAAPTRAHIGRAVVACGAASDIHEAFRRYLSRGCPAFVGKEPTPPKIVFERVHAAGGVVCLAHPGRMHGEDEIRRWASEGLDGVEVVHPANPPAVRSRMHALAGELGLLRCGGSDWHGPDAGRRGVPGWAHVPMRWMEEIGRRSRRKTEGQLARGSVG